MHRLDTIDSAVDSGVSNPLLRLTYEPAVEERLGKDFYDVVKAAEFPLHRLRWRNDDLLPVLGLDPAQVTDDCFLEAFGRFQGVRPFLALRYHGYQFGAYNPQLGDGRGFLYGQVRGTDGELYDFGTKGSGRTPYSRTADGRLTLKGGVREVLAAEALHRLGVRTSRCLSLVETGEELWRGDEPSPTRSSVMVRFSRSHLRFGTFERLHWHGRGDLVRKLIDFTIAHYYPDLQDAEDRDARWFAAVVERTARLAAQWMVAGFCHGVLNTDNMSITGESFDYGPYAFIDRYDPHFTAAYFDYYGRYAYANQPEICYWNLEKLQIPLRMVVPDADLEAGLSGYAEWFKDEYRTRLVRRLGLAELEREEAEALLQLTLTFLAIAPTVGYHEFFIALRQQFEPGWRADAAAIFARPWPNLTDAQRDLLERWRSLYHHLLLRLPESDLPAIAARLAEYNPETILLRPEIERVWKRIDRDDDWQPFYELIARLRMQ